MKPSNGRLGKGKPAEPQTQSLVPLATEMLRSGDFTLEEVIGLVERHYQETLGEASELHRGKASTDVDNQLLRELYAKEVKRREELEEDLRRIAYRYMRTVDGRASGGELVSPPSAMAKWGKLIQSERQKDEALREALTLPGGALKKNATSAKALASLNSGTMNSTGSGTTRIGVSYDLGQQRLSLTSGSTAIPLTPHGDGDPFRSDDTDATPAMAALQEELSLSQDKATRLLGENQALHRELDTLRDELRATRKVLNASLQERRMLASSHQALSLQCLTFQDEKAKLEEDVKRLQKKHMMAEIKSEAKVNNALSNLQRAERTAQENADVFHKSELQWQETVHGLRRELIDVRRSAATREAELLVIVEQTKALLRAAQAGDDSSKGDDTDLISKHLEPLREALAEALRRAERAETELENLRAAEQAARAQFYKKNGKKEPTHRTNRTPAKSHSPEEPSDPGEMSFHSKEPIKASNQVLDLAEWSGEWKLSHSRKEEKGPIPHPQRVPPLVNKKNALTIFEKELRHSLKAQTTSDITALHWGMDQPWVPSPALTRLMAQPAPKALTPGLSPAKHQSASEPSRVESVPLRRIP